MRNAPVNWYEGLFLRPQHFQANERWWSEQLNCSQRWDNPYHYGIRRIVFSEEALRNQQFEVTSLEARMRDGTLVKIGEGSELDQVDLKRIAQSPTVRTSLKNAFEDESVIRVYLGVPKLQLGRENLLLMNGRSDKSSDSNGTGQNGNGPTNRIEARYREIAREVHDENRAGNDQQIHLRQLNVRILLSTDDHSGYELLPIAQIKRASDRESAPQLDRDYIPPVLAISNWPGLGRDCVRGIYDIIGQKLEVLSEQVRNRGIARQSLDPADADRVAMLEVLNEAYSTLGVLAFVDGVHPLSAYTELCRIVGKLSIFGEQRRAIELPPYDHEDLGNIFPEIRRRIESLLFSVRDYEYQQRQFVGVGMGMQISLEPQWFNSNWHWYIGVKKGDLTEQECRTLLSPGHLDWKLGSSRQVEILFQRRAQGLQLEPLRHTVRALPAHSDWVFYEVARNESPAWRDVHDTQTLAMRLKDSLIENQDRLQGEQSLVVNWDGRNVTLQFALFAIPTQK
ncbi:MAG: type VI secretion system baseplate subunit TssK [Planctomycetales bacterium]|nr:type VI secretion system baseplate subunit TssK [Planctomycetales bacterium]